MSTRARGDVLQPAPSRDELTAALAGFLDWLGDRGMQFGSYAELWRWSTDQIEAFWGAIWDYYEVGTRAPDQILRRRVMPGADWFAGAELNYAQEISRRAPRGEATMLYMTEGQSPQPMSYDELWAHVGAFASVAATVRGRAGRPCCGIPAQPPRGGDCAARDGLDRSDLDRLRSRFRHPERA